MPVHTSTIGQGRQGRRLESFGQHPHGRRGARVGDRVDDDPEERVDPVRRQAGQPGQQRRPRRAGWPTDPSSGERATLPFSRISLRCLAVGCSVRCDLSAIAQPPKTWRHRPADQVGHVLGERDEGQADRQQRDQDLEREAEHEHVDLRRRLGQQGQQNLGGEQHHDDRCGDLHRGGEERGDVTGDHVGHGAHGDRGKRRPHGLEGTEEAVHDDQDGARGEQEGRRHQVVELADDRRLLQREGVEGLRKVEAREEIDQAAGGHDRRDEQRDDESEHEADRGLYEDLGQDLAVARREGVVLQRDSRLDGDAQRDTYFRHGRNRLVGERRADHHPRRGAHQRQDESDGEGG